MGRFQYRMPEEFRAKLQAYANGVDIFNWLRTTVTIDDEPRDVAVAFDVFRLIVAVADDGYVIQRSVDYAPYLMLTRTPEEVIRYAVFSCLRNPDQAIPGTLDEALEDEDVICVQTA